MNRDEEGTANCVATAYQQKFRKSKYPPNYPIGIEIGIGIAIVIVIAIGIGIVSAIVFGHIANRPVVGGRWKRPVRPILREHTQVGLKSKEALISEPPPRGGGWI